MEKKRIIRGNNTVFPTGAEVLGMYATSVITDHSKKARNGQMLSNEQCVIESRLYNEEKKV